MDVGAARKTSPDAHIDSATRIQSSKPLSFSNGVLKRHHHQTAFNNQKATSASAPGVVVYKECLKNHAASLGAHAVDGCGEFMPSPEVNSADPSTIKCAACGCHRNFHRQEPEDGLTFPSNTLAIEYHPHHRHHPPPPSAQPPPPPPGSLSSPSSESPPPISSSYYPSAPHLLLTLSGGMAAATIPQDHLTPPGNRSAPVILHSNGRKRFRTRFTEEQKGKMLDFAEKLCWKMQKKDEGLITGFCQEIGVEKGVFKVWMHNNKNNPGKSNPNPNLNMNPIPNPSTSNNGNLTEIADQYHQKNENLNENEVNDHFQEQNPHQHDDRFSGRGVAPYGSSTSS